MNKEHPRMRFLPTYVLKELADKKHSIFEGFPIKVLDEEIYIENFSLEDSVVPRKKVIQIFSLDDKTYLTYYYCALLNQVIEDKYSRFFTPYGFDEGDCFSAIIYEVDYSSVDYWSQHGLTNIPRYNFDLGNFIRLSYEYFFCDSSRVTLEDLKTAFCELLLFDPKEMTWEDYKIVEEMMQQWSKEDNENELE